MTPQEKELRLKAIADKSTELLSEANTLMGELTVRSAKLRREINLMQAELVEKIAVDKS